MLRSGSICISFLYKYLTSDNSSGNSELVKNHNKLRCLTETFQSHGGVLAKLSQILCTDSENDKVFSECKPFSREKTIEYLKKEYENKIFFKDVNYIDFEVYKSGSVGQVHKALYTKDGAEKDIVIKVQYVGLEDQVKVDLYILDLIISTLYKFSDLSNAMIDIKTKLYEELDYTIELSNSQLIYDIWKDSENIKIAKVIPEISNKKILAMEYINAVNLTEFMKNSTQDNKNIIGLSIVEFIFTNMYKHGIFYSDIHYGNFLIDDKKLYVMDFGCLNIIDDILLKNLKELHRNMRTDNTEKFYTILENMGIINSSISKESKDYIYEYFKIQYQPWICENFEFTEEWLDISVYKDTNLMKEWNLPSNMIYLNKIPYGLYHILTKLKIKSNFIPFFEKLL